LYSSTIACYAIRHRSLVSLAQLNQRAFFILRFSICCCHPVSIILATSSLTSRLWHITVHGFHTGYSYVCKRTIDRIQSIYYVYTAAFRNWPCMRSENVQFIIIVSFSKCVRRKKRGDRMHHKLCTGYPLNCMSAQRNEAETKLFQNCFETFFKTALFQFRFVARSVLNDFCWNFTTCFLFWTPLYSVPFASSGSRSFENLKGGIRLTV